MAGAGGGQTLTTLFSPETPVRGERLSLGPEAVAHLRALRLGTGADVRVTDGRGTRAAAEVTRIARDVVHVDVGQTDFEGRAGGIHLLVPVADKERLLWLAEKSVELGAASWRPVVWNRSRSVTGCGAGVAFQRRLLARMTAALEQSGGAWLPSVFPECEVALALTALPQGDRLLLDPRSDTAFPRRLPAATVIAIGPEGGLEEKEIAQIHAVGFNSVSLGSTVLRFETAALAALVLARAAFAVGDND